jgi:hypothetical protein
MQTRSYVIENPYEAALTIAPIEFKDGKEKRRERRKKQRKSTN